MRIITQKNSNIQPKKIQLFLLCMEALNVTKWLSQHNLRRPRSDVVSLKLWNLSRTNCSSECKFSIFITFFQKYLSLKRQTMLISKTKRLAQKKNLSADEYSCNEIKQQKTCTKFQEKPVCAS